MTLDRNKKRILDNAHQQLSICVQTNQFSKALKITNELTGIIKWWMKQEGIGIVKTKKKINK
jgi:hypothetical protein